MGLLHRVHDGFQLLLPGLVHRVLEVLTNHGHIGGNLHHVHAVDLTELFFLRQGRTGGAAFFLEQIKEILEGDGGQGLALPLHLYMLLGLYGLVQAVGIAPSGHDTSRELVYDQHLIIFDYVVLVAEHQIVCPEGQYNIVLDLQVLGIRIVLDVEEVLHLFHPGLGEVDDLVLFVDDEVPALLLDHAHDSVHLGQFSHVLASLHPAGQQVAHLVESGGFAALT